MNRLNSDYIKPHSTDPTGTVAFLAVLAVAAAAILVPVGIVKGVSSLIEATTPHRTAVTAPQTQSAPHQSGPR